MLIFIRAMAVSHHMVSFTVGRRVWSVKVDRADPCGRDRKWLELSQRSRARLNLRRQRICREKNMNVRLNVELELRNHTGLSN